MIAYGEMNHTLYNIMEWVIFITCILATIGGIAISRAEDIYESPLVAHGRKIVNGGWVIITVRLGYLAIFEDRQTLSFLGGLSLWMLAAGSVIIFYARILHTEIEAAASLDSFFGRLQAKASQFLSSRYQKTGPAGLDELKEPKRKK